MTSRALPGGKYELTATATPSANVDALDLSFVVPPGATIDRGKQGFGVTARGQQRVVTAIVEPRDRTTDISVVAQVPVEGIAMSKTAMVTLGEPRPEPRTKVYAMPDGERAREVRP